MLSSRRSFRSYRALPDGTRVFRLRGFQPQGVSGVSCSGFGGFVFRVRGLVLSTWGLGVGVSARIRIHQSKNSGKTWCVGFRFWDLGFDF